MRSNPSARGIYTASVMIACLALAPAVSAAGPPLAVDNNTIWNQYTTEGGCCTSFGSTMKDDPLFQGSGNFGSLYVLPAAASTSFVLDYEITPQEFPAPVLLDVDGTLDFTVNLGAGTSTGGAAGVAVVDVTAAFLQGGTVLAQGSAQEVIDHAGDGYKTLTWSLAVPQARLDPVDGMLSWQITITGAASGIYVSHTDENGNGWVTMPIIGVEGGTEEPVTVYTDLEDPVVTAEFTSATSETHVYNFTNDLSAAVAQFDVNGTGLATATLIDADGTELFNGTAESGAIDLGNVTTGAWQLIVDYADFNGTFAFGLSAPDVDGPVDGHDDPDAMEGGHDETDGNETVQDGGDDKESPAAALPLLLVTLGLLALRRRL